MAGKPQHLTLSAEEDEQLRRIEQSPHIKPKVRLRASIIRLNAAGWSRRKIAEHTGRTYATICQDLGRWNERGTLGLADGVATNQPESTSSFRNPSWLGIGRKLEVEKLSPDIRAFVLEKLQEQRTWTCNQLIEAVEKTFGVKVGREAMRLRILRLGYCWKRTRYVPCKQIDPEVEREHKASLDTLKRGRRTTA